MIQHTSPMTTAIMGLLHLRRVLLIPRPMMLLAEARAETRISCWPNRNRYNLEEVNFAIGLKVVEEAADFEGEGVGAEIRTGMTVVQGYKMFSVSSRQLAATVVIG